jgi:glucose-6-phosphate 1-dehydrogenase
MWLVCKKMIKKDIIITIFGATGDLTARKLLPAIASLYNQKELSENIMVIAVGRKDYDTKTYLQKAEDIMQSSLPISQLNKFVIYQKINILKLADYAILRNLIEKNSSEKTKKLFYLAIGPDLIIDIARNINYSGLVQKNNNSQAIIFEKPFGDSLKSAKALNKMLWQYFDEEQIFRIDHYLGKEMIQNILTIRFSNRIFEEVWSKKTIKSITIMAKEKNGILNRANYYDKSGAVKDMLQSHLLQILSLLAIKSPKSYYSCDVKNEKVKIMKRLSFDKNSLLFGQYKGYFKEKDIPKDSKTETFVFLKTFVNTKKFKGIPIYLITGKKLKEKETVITIEFKETKEQHKWNLPLKTNKLHIKVSPDDGIRVAFNNKMPGLRDDIKQVELEYVNASHAVGNIPEAYERLLLDAIMGSKTLFTRWDEIELLWKFTDKIKKNQKGLFIYKNEEELMHKIKLITGCKFNEKI